MTAPNFPKPPPDTSGRGVDRSSEKPEVKPAAEHDWLTEASRLEELALLALEHGLSD